jgi:hypothetical protein
MVRIRVCERTLSAQHLACETICILGCDFATDFDVRDPRGVPREHDRDLIRGQTILSRSLSLGLRERKTLECGVM